MLSEVCAGWDGDGIVLSLDDPEAVVADERVLGFIALYRQGQPYEDALDVSRMSVCLHCVIRDSTSTYLSRLITHTQRGAALAETALLQIEICHLEYAALYRSESSPCCQHLSRRPLTRWSASTSGIHLSTSLSTCSVCSYGCGAVELVVRQGRMKPVNRRLALQTWLMRITWDAVEEDVRTSPLVNSDLQGAVRPPKRRVGRRSRSKQVVLDWVETQGLA